MPILSACTPREDLLKGTFNPEIFTASLGAVMKFYRGERSGIHSIYADADAFFREATYPSNGIKSVLADVFGRLAGDNSVPAIHRLETGFGGGKTHTLIACAHIGFKGSAIADAVGDLLDPSLLPAAGNVAVIGIAGDKIPVHKPKGDQLLPHTLWGEIAFQIGGETLYQAVAEEAASYAAPGENFLQKAFGDRKVLLMIDELAQYAARFMAARPDARHQLEAFLLTLHGYARDNPHIAVVETLASAKDAFAAQTRMLAELLSQDAGKDMDADTALGIGQTAVEGISSVVARDATSVVPVQAAEISRVLAKRLFLGIDPTAALETAQKYTEMYRKNSALLPDEAVRADYRDRLVAHYPFHPTLINFLNNKLASYENFQGTRGVLRVLALAVRNIWQKEQQIPMIHTCHIDLRDPRTVNEVVGRTGSGDLLTVLNADVGGADTDSLTGGRSNAEIADQRNVHPEGWPMYEYTWKTIFLHSLVGREQGLGSNIFGLTETEALFEVAFPGLTPPQVAEALKEINESAYYLRFNQGRYYASLDPSINIALAKIRRSLSPEETSSLLDAFARKVVSADMKTFKVIHDVMLPEHIADNQGSPVLAMVSLNADKVDIEAMVTTVGPNRPRLEQNNVVILVPETVSARTQKPGQEPLFNMTSGAARQARESLQEMARTVLAMRRLNKNPQSHGIQPQRLQKDDFKQRFSEREKALETVVTQSYKYLWYPSADGQIVCREIRTSGGEGGAPVMEQLRKTLLEDGELIITERINREVLSGLRKLFFIREETVKMQQLRDNFKRLRSWPMLESPSVLDQMIRSGVTYDSWCLFRMGSEDATNPAEFYSRDGKEMPYQLELKPDHAIVTPEGARKRGWVQTKGPDPVKVESLIKNAAFDIQIATVDKIKETVVAHFGSLESKLFEDTVAKLVQNSRLLSYKGTVDQTEKPSIIAGAKAAFYNPEAADVLITPAKAAERGWIAKKENKIELSGTEGTNVLMPLLRRIGSIYQRGGKTKIDILDITDIGLPEGGSLRISLSDVPPESLKDMGELFEVIDALAEKNSRTEVFLEINDPQEGCPFIKELLPNKIGGNK